MVYKHTCNIHIFIAPKQAYTRAHTWDFDRNSLAFCICTLKFHCDMLQWWNSASRIGTRTSLYFSCNFYHSKYQDSIIAPWWLLTERISSMSKKRAETWCIRKMNSVVRGQTFQRGGLSSTCKYLQLLWLHAQMAQFAHELIGTASSNTGRQLRMDFCTQIHWKLKQM